MSLQRYRRIEDMPPLPAPADPTATFGRLRGLWATWARLLPPLDLPPGVRRYRSVEEADADREAANRRRARGRRALRDRTSVRG